MIRHSISFGVIFLTLICIHAAQAGGAAISVLLINGQEVKGELLYATAESLMVSKVTDAPDWQLAEKPELIAWLSRQEMREVTVQGESHILAGMGIGLAVGALGGVIVGAAAGTSDNSTVNAFSQPIGAGVYGVIGAVSGLVLGAVIGGGSSRSGEQADVTHLNDLLYFQKYARYSQGLPQFLKPPHLIPPGRNDLFPQ